MQNIDTKAHILVITENKNHEIILQKKFQGLFVIFLSNAEFEKEVFHHITFSFIIIDESSKGDTLLVLKIIKKKLDTKNVPILVILSKLNKTYLESLIHQGISNFIPMPIADENILDILKETAALKKSNKAISSFAIPIKEAIEKDLMNHSVIDKEIIHKIKVALSLNSLVCLAIISYKDKLEGIGDLTIKVKDSLFCVLSLTKNKKQMAEDILFLKKNNLYAGIVSTEDTNYSDFSAMIKDGQKALERARKTQHGISFSTKP